LANEMNIKYFLLPRSAHFAYSFYSYYYNTSNLFKTVVQQQILKINETVFSFSLLKSFPSASVDLYVLRQFSDSDLKHYIDFQENSSIISDDNQTSLFSRSSQEISLSDVSSNPAKGANSLQITVLNSSTQQQFIRHNFNDPFNISTKDFVSFYWYGNSSGLRIALRFWTGDWQNQFEYVFCDNWEGWAKIIVPLESFSIHAGSPSFENLTSIVFVFLDNPTHESATFRVDQIVADIGIKEPLTIPFCMFAS